MTTSTSNAEIRLYRAMMDNNLTIGEAVIAMEQFRDQLNVESLDIYNTGVDTTQDIYDNNFVVLDEWDTWSD
jgi:hypothetical protein|tara:strand:+ start:373 stop:588 length:216 start_codon:yes stop_codon:yes gene_type:complete